MTRRRPALRILVVGSGVGGSILARVLARQGHQVTLLERSRHPRFALGESSTPLAGLSLERLARRWDLPDLAHLATYEAWSEHLAPLRRGLKRGFTFIDQRKDTSDSNRRLLVAASPADRCADAHWLRADVDHHLVQRAETEGIEVVQGIELEPLEPPRPGTSWRWAGRVGSEAIGGTADFIIDASGRHGWLSTTACGPAPSQTTFRTRLLANHFEGVRPLQTRSGDPYPAGAAAVHHLLDEGWLYELRFDDGRTSAGLVLSAPLASRLDDSGKERNDQETSFRWTNVLKKYPELGHRFATATPCEPWVTSAQLQFRKNQSVGPGWALLPNSYAFWSPLFSTGIAWNLLAVERLAEVFDPSGRTARSSGLVRYSTYLEEEATHLRHLVETAYGSMSDFDRFHAATLVYFAAASYSEVLQRVRDQPEVPPCWSKFLGAGDPVLAVALRQLANCSTKTPGSLSRRMVEVLSPRDLVGLDAGQASALYPADLETVLSRLDRLPLSQREKHRAASRLEC